MTQAEIQRQLSNAARAQQSGNRSAYLGAIDAVLRLDPTEPQARNAMGREALARNDYAGAVTHFEVAAARDPAAPALWLNLATARRGQGDDDAERAALERVLDIDRLNLTALIRLAQLHERRNEEGKAVEYWGAVSSLGSQRPDAPRDLQQWFAHARSYVSKRHAVVAERVGDAVDDLIAKAGQRDARRAAAARDVMLGRRSVFPNQPQGFHYPFLPADEYFDRDHFPWFEQLEAATDVIRDELLAILASNDPGLTPYVQMESGLPDTKWKVLDHNLDWSSLHLWREGTRVDEACARAPKTAALIEALPLCDIPGRAPTAFFSILKAGKAIPPHTGVTNIRTIIHLPLIVPGKCAFRVGGETREWKVGEAFAFDDSIEHEAWNRSGEDRAILILDTWNPHLSLDERAMIRAMFAAADGAGFNPRA
nr:aspartyl/asparaginyl beta-hydroxylase domain-containing protein [uncultured Sphingomonas sp.]